MEVESGGKQYRTDIKNYEKWKTSCHLYENLFVLKRFRPREREIEREIVKAENVTSKKNG